MTLGNYFKHVARGKSRKTSTLFAKHTRRHVGSQTRVRLVQPLSSTGGLLMINDSLYHFKWFNVSITNITFHYRGPDADKKSYIRAWYEDTRGFKHRKVTATRGRFSYRKGRSAAPWVPRLSRSFFFFFWRLKRGRRAACLRGKKD